MVGKSSFFGATIMTAGEILVTKVSVEAFKALGEALVEGTSVLSPEDGELSSLLRMS